MHIMFINSGTGQGDLEAYPGNIDLKLGMLEWDTSLWRNIVPIQHPWTLHQ